jgi:hypothetical protein
MNIHTHIRIKDIRYTQAGGSSGKKKGKKAERQVSDEPIFVKAEDEIYKSLSLFDFDFPLGRFVLCTYCHTNLPFLQIHECLPVCEEEVRKDIYIYIYIYIHTHTHTHNAHEYSCFWLLATEHMCRRGVVHA